MKFNIKPGIFFVIIVCSFTNSFAQPQAIETVAPHYLFPKFEMGLVKMKDGTQHKVLLNYNMVTEEMVFDSNGQKLALSNGDYVDTIYLNSLKFIPFKKIFLECAYQGNIKLLVQNKRRLIDQGAPAGYGGTSSTAAITQKSSIESSGMIYELKIQKDFKVSNDNIYWVEVNHNMNKFFTEKQFLKLFPEKTDLIKKFIKNQKTNFKQKEDVIALIKYLNEI